MLQFIRKKLGRFFDDIDYNGKRLTAHVVGKGGIKAGVEQLAMAVPGLTATHGAAFLIAAPLSAAFSSMIVQRDHLHRRDELLEQYRGEIAAYLGGDKKREDLTIDDLERAAYGDAKTGKEGNPSLKEALDQSARERNWGVGISCLSSLISAGIVASLGMHTATEAGIDVGKALTLGAISLAVYLPVSTTLHWVAETFFGLEKETTQERIHDIRRSIELGKSVSKEQVLDVYIGAHPELDNRIQASYGKKFEKLNAAQREQVTEIIGSQINLDTFTQEINNGYIRPEELAFVVHGQVSGLEAHDPAQKLTGRTNIFARAWDACIEKLDNWGKPKSAQHQDTAPAETIPQAVHVEAASRDNREQVTIDAAQAEQNGRKTSFVQMVGAKRGVQGNISFVEQVEQSRNGGGEMILGS